MTRRQIDRLLTLHIVQRILAIIMLAILFATIYLIVTRLHAIAAPMLAVPILKMVHPDMSADSDRTFFYPTSGPIVDRGGQGLHGYAYAIGERGYVAELINLRMTWLVLTANQNDVLTTNRRGKAVFRRGNVIGVYPADLTAAVRHIADLTKDWTQPAAAAMLAQYQWHDDYLWAVHRVLSPGQIYMRTLGPAPALDAWGALMADINTMDAPAPSAAPAIDDVDAAHRAAQLALAERIQRQRKAARQRLRLEHRPIAVDWPVPVVAR